MNELKKLRDEMHEHHRKQMAACGFAAHVLLEWADTLDAYIKKQESVEAWDVEGIIRAFLDKEITLAHYFYESPQSREPISLQAIVSALESSWDNAERAKALRALGIEVKTP